MLLCFVAVDWHLFVSGNEHFVGKTAGNDTIATGDTQLITPRVLNCGLDTGEVVPPSSATR